MPFDHSPCEITGAVVVAVVLATVFAATSRKKPDRRGSNHSGDKPLFARIGESHRAIAAQADGGRSVYLDYNATTPVFEEVYAKMVPFLTTCFGNPSSSHVFSRPCSAALRQARLFVGALVRARRPQTEIVFTSCGTESDNRAVDIALHHYYSSRDICSPIYGMHTPSGDSNVKYSGVSDDVAVRVEGPSTADNPQLRITLPRVVSTLIEHPAVIGYLRHLEKLGVIELLLLPVSEEGVVSTEAVRRALSPHTALVSIMHSNNEVGSIQPIKEIGLCIAQYNRKLSHNHQKAGYRVLFHSDGAQSLGKVLCLDVEAMGVDMFTIVGHKFGAPKGVAALYIKEGVKACPFTIGGGQERGLRGGGLVVHFPALSLHCCMPYY